MKSSERAQGFVSRADHALAEPENMVQRWEETIRSKTDERLVHSFPTPIDTAIRRIREPHPHWDACDGDTVRVVVQAEAFQVLRVLSAHPSGWVREEVVRQMANLEFGQVAPHLANRVLDFVPSIREVAQPIVQQVLSSLLKERTAAGSTDSLPSAANIVIGKLIRPRAATVCPELVQLGVELGKTAVDDRPGRLRENDDPMVALAPYRQVIKTTSDPNGVEALEAIIEYLST